MKYLLLGCPYLVVLFKYQKCYLSDIKGNFGNAEKSSNSRSILHLILPFESAKMHET